MPAQSAIPLSYPDLSGPWVSASLPPEEPPPSEAPQKSELLPQPVSLATRPEQRSGLQPESPEQQGLPVPPPSFEAPMAA